MCVIDEDRCHRVADERTRFYCSNECRWLDESNPGRYTGDRNFFDRYHGWETSDVVRDLGFVRADGASPIGQPHLERERRWTLADIRAHDLKVQSPNIRVAHELGLPSGDWSGTPGGNGNVPLELAETDLASGRVLR
jgi:propane monooxygenase large subunit